jgi:hypothetical protein
MCIFDTSTAQVEDDNLCKSDISSEQVLHNYLCKSDTSTAQALHPSLNIINNINNKTLSDENSESEVQGKEISVPSENNNPQKHKIKENENKKIKSGEINSGGDRIGTGNNSGRKLNDSGSGISLIAKPSLNEVIEFFKMENYPEIEAKKFFNHFESNGWKVGGKTPMKNWHAAARNWMLNCGRFIPPQDFPRPKEKPKPGPNNKNYSEPL